MTKFANEIINDGNGYWLVREAVSREAAEDAIGMARATGSVGSKHIESRGDVETVTADVVRLNSDGRECLGGNEYGTDHSALIELFQTREQTAHINRALDQSSLRNRIRAGALDELENLATGEFPIHHDAAYLRTEMLRIITEAKAAIMAAHATAQAGA